MSRVYLSITLSLNSFLRHLVPLGCPVGLRPFIVLVERVSLVIRPLTLSVRLIANIVAGHLLLCLLSSPFPAGSSRLLISTGLIILVVLERAVAFIQAYVLVTLVALYVQEAYDL